MAKGSAAEVINKMPGKTVDSKQRARPKSQSGRYARGARAGTWKPRVAAFVELVQCSKCQLLQSALEAAEQKAVASDAALRASNQRCLQLAAAMNAANLQAAAHASPCIVVRPAPCSWTLTGGNLTTSTSEISRSCVKIL